MALDTTVSTKPETNSGLFADASSSSPQGGEVTDNTKVAKYVSGIQKSGDMGNDEYPVVSEKNATSLTFRIPNWGYKDFLNDRVSWQKQLSSITGDPGWFYFKIFFHFDTSFGLFGGTLGPGDIGKAGKTIRRDNCALSFLKAFEKLYIRDKLAERADALVKFASILSFINGHAPWFWQSITGLDKAGHIDLKDPFKKRQLEIGCLEDAIDMRLTTLMDLYKFACFDYINFKEIIPENLRKFDMTVVIMNSPIRYYHTGMSSHSGKFDYKDLSGSNDDDRMSFKMYTFHNCEFVADSFGTYVPSEITNSTPFNLGKNNIIIQYDRCYQHTSNEFSKILFGDDGFYKENMGKQSKRIKALQNAIGNMQYNPNSENYKALVDSSESNINDYMRTVSGSAAFGNLYGDEYGIDSYYYKEKLKTLHDGADFLHQGGTLRGDYHKTTNYLGMIIDNPLAGAATALRSSATNAITNAVTKFINKLF